MKNLISDTSAVHNLKTTTKLFKESLDDFFKLFDSSPSAMAITDVRRLKFVKVNEKFVEFFGYKKEEVIGRTAIDISIHDKTEFNRILNFLKENQGFQNQIFKGRTKDGRVVYLIASSEIMEINGKKYSVSSFLDITKIKEQQIIIERQNKDIFDSINYARLIQKAIFPSKKHLEDVFPNSFVLAKPKHIVSGDFHQRSDQELDQLFGESLLPEPSDRYKTLEPFFPTMEKELKKRGITRHILWERYIALHPDGFKASQFKYHYQQWLRRSKPVMHIEHIAGDKMYIDYAGEKLHLVNKETGEISDAEVFISVLGASQLTYVEATLSQCKEDFINCCEHALAYYEGVPLAIVPDNLKSAVTKSSLYEPTLNQAFENFALHYSTTILPARAYKPKDKALVEGAVKIAYRRIYSVLDNKVFHTVILLFAQ